MATKKQPVKKQPAAKVAPKKAAAPKKTAPAKKVAPKKAATPKAPARPKYRYTANVVVNGSCYTEKENGKLMGGIGYVEKDAKLYSSRQTALDKSNEIASQFGRKSVGFVTRKKIKG